MSERGSVVVTGSTGLVGSRLLPLLIEAGYDVRAITRDAKRAAGRLPGGAQAVGWDGLHVPPQALSRSVAVVHLAGEPIFAGPLTARRREKVRTSRVDSTRALVQTLGRMAAEERPRVLACASAVGFYGSRGEEILDESARAGQGFLAELCVDWETAAHDAEAHGIRVVSLRIGLVLARDGGALPLMARAFRLALGGRIGSGRQWVPWVHVDDLVRLVRTTLEDERLAGPVNAVSPVPVRNEELTRELARAVHRPAILPVPAFALRALLGDLAGELLDSRRVVPRQAEAHGFGFGYPRLPDALAAELGS